MEVLRARRSFAFVAVLCAVLGFDAPARAQSAASQGRIFDMAVPEGLAEVLGLPAEALTPARSHALTEFIRRTYDRPLVKSPHLDAPVVFRPNGSPGAAGPHDRGPDPHAATLPLPLPPDVWIEAVFAGRATPDTLPGAILGSRGPALFYYGLLSLDDDTRAWLASEPQLIAELAGRHAAAFVVAAPGLRVRRAALDVPGGWSAAPMWEALVGHRTTDAPGFVRALLAHDKGRLAFFFGTIAQLTPAQLRAALRLDAPDPAARLAAARRLRDVYERLTKGWLVDDSVFLRPALDPALLAASLRHDETGRLVIPGTRGFWTAVFDGNPAGVRPIRRAAREGAGAPEPADFAWLCEQVFTGQPSDDRWRYLQVLFVSRLEAHSARWVAPEAIDVVRAIPAFPALVYSLERAKLVDVSAYAAAVRRAQLLTAVRDAEAGARALAQFQGALALVTRAGARAGVRPDQLAATISSLARVELGERNHYEGRLVRWVAGWLEAHARSAPAREPDVVTAGPMEWQAVAALAGPAGAPRFVEWEGTRYRVDFAAAERLRIARLLGTQPTPLLSSARALVETADAIGGQAAPSGGIRHHADALGHIARALGWEAGTDAPRQYGDAAAALRQAAGRDDLRLAARVAPTLLQLADELLARGLTELAYAVALGQPDRPAISAGEAARRHEFTRQLPLRRFVAWEFPERGPVSQGGWHVRGSLLGLDLLLADLALRRLSMKPPGRKPTLVEQHRTVLIENVALVDAASLADEDQSRIVAALAKGRARLAAARTADDALALAEEIRLSPARRTLVSWAIAKVPGDAAALLAPSELLWLGLDQAPVAAGLHAWGAPAGPRTGCLCLEVLDRQPWETFAGRRFSGALSSGFSDLNLRLAELLHELGMPAPLLAPVLAAATLDLVETAQPSDPDDRQALVDFVLALRAERVEQYLALLTTGGPLVPVDRGGTQ